MNSSILPHWFNRKYFLKERAVGSEVKRNKTEESTSQTVNHLNLQSI